ncbi:lactonase family protein [Streptomyces sp. NPDC002262]|uniref:lactonase family protein n=1 Tax=Streptomyces sp. NPDC002262 TaxID=3154414 RepID=UPI00332165CA
MNHTPPRSASGMNRSLDRGIDGRYLVIGSGAPATGPETGLHRVRRDEAGTLTPHQRLALDQPSYVVADTRRGIVHAVVEQDVGAIVSLALDDRGGLRTLTTVATGGALPCHVALHPDGTHLFVAHYGDGALSVLPLAADGGIATTEPVQTVSHPGRLPGNGLLPGPHAHMAAPSPDGRFVLSTDLGTDRIYVYAFEPESGNLSPHQVVELSPGSGPRHLVFHPLQPYVYVINELASSVVVCAWDRRAGRLAPGPVLPAREDPASTTANYPAAIRISADGRYVYTTNRGDDTIAVHAVLAEGASLELRATVSCGGSWPRDICLSPDGLLLYCANQRSDTVTVFRVDPNSGVPFPTGQPFPVTAPTSVLPTPGYGG